METLSTLEKYGEAIATENHPEIARINLEIRNQNICWTKLEILKAIHFARLRLHYNKMSQKSVLVQFAPDSFDRSLPNLLHEFRTRFN